MMKSLLPSEIKVNITIDYVRLRSKLTTSKTFRFTQKKDIFYTRLGPTQSHSGVLGDINGFFQLMPGSHESDKPINITCIDKIHLKCDYNNGSILNGVREPIFRFCIVLL